MKGLFAFAIAALAISSVSAYPTKPIKGCLKTVIVQSGDDCPKYEQKYHLTFKQLQAWNVGLLDNCLNMDNGHEFCIQGPKAPPKTPSHKTTKHTPTPTHKSGGKDALPSPLLSGVHKKHPKHGKNGLLKHRKHKKHGKHGEFGMPGDHKHGEHKHGKHGKDEKKHGKDDKHHGKHEKHGKDNKHHGKHHDKPVTNPNVQAQQTPPPPPPPPMNGM